MVGNLGISKNELSHLREKPVKDYIIGGMGFLTKVYIMEKQTLLLVMERV
jgi:hypothetical protein